MPSVSQTYAGQFLNAGELAPLGQRRAAVVHGVELETVGQGGDAKNVLVLELVTASGKAWPKKVVLNKTNSTMLASVYGDNTDHWTGKPVELWAENVMFQGKLVPGIKVAPGATLRPAAATPAQAAPATAPIIDDEIPF
jgi:hypothetical protein